MFLVTDIKALLFVMEQNSGLNFDLEFEYQKEIHKMGTSSDFDRKSGRFVDTLFFLDNQQFCSMHDWFLNARLGDKRIVDIKDKTKVTRASKDVLDLLSEYKNHEKENTNKDITRLERKTYGSEGTVQKVTLLVLTFLSVLCFTFAIIGYLQVDIELFKFLGAAIIITGILIYLLIKPIKYRHLSSKVIIDEKGVYYNSRVKEYFMPWEQVGVVESRIQKNEYYTFFFSKNMRKLIYKNEPKYISNNLIFVAFDNRVIDLINIYWTGNVVGIKHLNTKEEIKELRKNRKKI